ncbi:MAG TPA: hypothetical protein DCO77_00060, partial [Nitrospiraceae bacterium]|nr:hypothetical protein [Nitrospiraceae bacterium]
FGHSAATDGTYIYSFGGKSDSSTYLDEFLRCHLTTHSCETPLVTGPSARAFHSVSMAGTTMYIFGGEFSDGSTVDKLDDLWTIPLPPTTWTEEVPALSTAAPSSAYHAAVKYGTKLYFFGGNDVIVDTVWAWESTRTSYGNEMIAFVDGGGGNDQITDTANGFVAAGFLSGDDIVVSGSASNDGAYTILAITAGTIDVATGSLTDEAAGAAVTIRTGYAGSTIAFDVGDTVTDLITDSANGFVAAGFQEGDDIVVSGSASNDGQYTILSVDAGTIKVAEARLTAESAGASVTLTELDWAQRTKPASSPLGRRAPTAVVMNDGTDDRMYLFGGQSGGVGINTLWAYKLSDAAAAVENLFTWEQMTSIPSQ